MANPTDDLFPNPTNREAVDSLQQLQRRASEMYSDPIATPEEFNDLMGALSPRRGKFGETEPSAMISGLADIAGQYADDAPLAPDGQDHVKAGTSEDSFLDSFARAHTREWGNVVTGASLISNDDATNMMAVEEKYQRLLKADPEPERWTSEAKTFSEGIDQFFDGKHRFFDSDFWGNFAGGTMPSIEGMVTGAGLGAGTAAATTAVTGPGVVIGTGVGALTGAAAGSSTSVFLQTMGGTMVDAYTMYRQKGLSVKEAYEKAYEVAQVDAAKSGAFAGLAVLIAPARLVGAGAAATGASKIIPRVRYSAPVGEGWRRTAAIQFGQQSLVVQPTLEVADVVSSNSIAKSSYDPKRIMHQGSVDAFIGSIFFDIPTTAGGILIQRTLQRGQTAGTDLVSAPRQLEYMPAFDDPAAAESGPLALPPSDPVSGYLPAPRFEAKLQEDGSWHVVDADEATGAGQGTFLAPETMEQIEGQIEGVRTQLTKAVDQIATISKAHLAKTPEKQASTAKAHEERIAKITAKAQTLEATLAQHEADAAAGLPPTRPAGPPDASVIFETAEEAFAEAARRNEHSRSEWASPWFPENRNSRESFVQEQVQRMTAWDSRQRATQENYTGSEKLNHAVSFFKWLGEADAIIEEINSLSIEERNSDKNQTRYADAKERLSILKMIMDPVRAVIRPQYIFTTKGKHYRVQLETGGRGDHMARPKRPRSPKTKKLMPNHIVIYDDTSETGFRTVAEASGELSSNSMPMPTNMLMTADVLSRLHEARRRMLLERGEVVPAPFDAPPALEGPDAVPLLTDQTEGQTDRQPRVEADIEAQAEEFQQNARYRKRKATVEERQDLAEADAIRSGEPEPGPIEVPPAETAAQGELDVTQGGQTAQQAADEYARQGAAAAATPVPTYPEGGFPNHWDVEQPPAGLTEGLHEPAGTPAPVSELAVEEKPAVEIEPEVQEILDTPQYDYGSVKSKTHFVYQTGSTVAKTARVVHRGTEASSKAWIITASKNFSHKGKDFVIYKGKYNTKKGAAQKGDKLDWSYVHEDDAPAPKVGPTQASRLSLIQRILNFVPEANKARVAKILKMYEDAIGPGFNSVEIMELAKWISNYEPTTPAEVAAIFGSYVNKLDGTVQKVIAVDFDMASYDVLNELSHELVHLAVKLKGLPDSGLIAWYRALPDSNYHKSYVESDVEYAKLNEARRAEEALARILSEMSTKRYSGRLHQESGLKYLIRQILRMFNELYEGITGINMVNAFLDNIASYGIETNPVNEFEAAAQASRVDEATLGPRPSQVDMRIRQMAFENDIRHGTITPENAESLGHDPNEVMAIKAEQEKTQYSRIPQDRRAQRSKPQGQPQRHTDGRPYRDHDLEQTSAKIDKLDFDVRDIWKEVIASYGSAGQILIDILTAQNMGKTVQPRENAFWLRSLQLPDRARFWYEISSERFNQIFRSFNDPAFLAKIIDVIAATSVQAGPLDNLLRAIAVLAEVMQKKGVLTDLTDRGQGAGVNKALSEDSLSGDKVGNFSGGMKYLMGLIEDAPLSTNDRQVAVYFDITGEILTNAPKTGVDADGKVVSLPSFYDMISEFHIRLRDRLNQQLPITAEPFETWQIQALGWVQIRADKKAEKGDVSGYDDYDQVIDEVFKRLEAAGVDMSSGELSPAVLQTPIIPFALRDTMYDFMTAPTATVETLTKLSPVGEVFHAVARTLAEGNFEGVAGIETEINQIQRRPLAELSTRREKFGARSLVELLVSVINGKRTSVSRMNIGYGTFEGEPNWNLRIPLQSLAAEERATFLSILGIAFNQAVMASHQLIPAEVGSTPRPGYSRSYRIFLENVKRDLFTKEDAAALDKALGFPLSGVRVANGNVIDIMVGGFEGKALTPQIVEAALKKTDIPKKGDIHIDHMDYKSVPGIDYLEAAANVDWLDGGRQVIIGYHQQVENYIEGIGNVAIAEIAGLDPRINIREAEAFFRKDYEKLYYFRKYKSGKIKRSNLPLAVLKRATRIRAEHHGRINNLRKIEAELASVFAQQELEQITFLDSVIPKLWNKFSADQQKSLTQPMTLIPELEETMVEEGIDTTQYSRINYNRASRATSEADTVAKKKAIMNWWTRTFGLSATVNIFTGSAKRIRQLAYNTKAAYKLSNILERDQFAYTGVNEQGKIAEDVNSEIEQLSAKFSGMYGQLLRGMTEAQKKAIPDILRGKGKKKDPKTGKWIIPLPKGFPAAKARKFRELLDVMWDALEQVYIEQGMTPPPKLQNYFPQKYKLNGKIHGVGKDQALESFFTAVFLDPDATEAQRESAEQAARDVTEKIKTEHYQPVWGNDLDIRDDRHSTRGRKRQIYKITDQEMHRIIRLDPYAKIDVVMPDGSIKKLALVDFLDNDTGMVLNNYVLSMARRIQFGRRFGLDGRIVGNIINKYQVDVFGERLHAKVQRDAEGNVVVKTDKRSGKPRLFNGRTVPVTEGPRVLGEIDQELVSDGKQPLTADERRDIMDLIRLNMGISDTGKIYQKTKEFQHGMKWYGNLAYLSLAVWHSLPEPMLIAVRLGFFPFLYGVRSIMHEVVRIPAKTTRAVYKTMQQSEPTKRDKWIRFREHYGYDMTDTREFAKDMGIIFENMQYVLQNTVEDLGVIRWDKLNNQFFRANLLQPLTEMQQVASLTASIQALHTWRRQALRGNKRAITNLTEVGLAVEDLADFKKSDAMGTANNKVRAALRSMNRQIIMAPSPGKKPGWMLDPRFSLIAHIKTWIMTFNNTVLQRAWRELAQKGNPMPLIYLAGFGMVSAMAYESREWMRWGEDGNPYLNRVGLEKGNPARLIYLAIERGGLAGPLQFGLDMYLSTRVSALNILDSIVPALNIINHGVGGAFKILASPLTTDSEERKKQFRRGLSDLTRALPLINASGQNRIDLVNKLTGKEPTSGGRKRSSRGRRARTRTRSRRIRR